MMPLLGGRTFGGKLLRAALWVILAATQSFSSSAEERQLEVVIVSIENFDDPAQYHNASLEQNITASTDALIAFFRERFPFAHLKILRKPDETTTTHLGEFFRGEFPAIADGNITILFVLSHGEALPYPNPEFGSDLRIVTTDTTPQTIPSKAISLSREIMGSLDGLRPGSFVFGFIDTCHSGAAQNIGLIIDDALRNALGVKAMFMASSLSDQLMYKASFTRALVTIWRETPPAGAAPACTAPEQSPDRIRAVIEEILKPQKLGPNEGYPHVLLRYNGQLCMETFGADSAIVGIINGTAQSYSVVFTSDDGRQYTQSVDRYEQIPVRLNRESYSMSVYNNNKLVESKKLDLKATPLYWEPLGNPSVEQLAAGLEVTARAGVFVDAPKVASSDLLQLSYAAYTAANNSGAAKRVASLGQLPACSGACDAILSEADRKTATNQWLEGADDPATLQAKAFIVRSFGNFRASASILSAAADKLAIEGNAGEKEAATQAYYAYLYSGDLSGAARVRDQHRLNMKAECAECERLRILASGHNGRQYRSALGDLAAARMLGSMTASGESEVARALISPDPNEPMKRVIPPP